MSIGGFQKQLYCPECQVNRLFVKTSVEKNKSLNTMYGCLALGTCGLLLPLAIVLSVIEDHRIKNQKFCCQTCGGSNGRIPCKSDIRVGCRPPGTRPRGEV